MNNKKCKLSDLIIGNKFILLRTGQKFTVTNKVGEINITVADNKNKRHYLNKTSLVEKVNG